MWLYFIGSYIESTWRIYREEFEMLGQTVAQVMSQIMVGQLVCWEKNGQLYYGVVKDGIGNIFQSDELSIQPLNGYPEDFWLVGVPLESLGFIFPEDLPDRFLFTWDRVENICHVNSEEDVCHFLVCEEMECQETGEITQSLVCGKIYSWPEIVEGHLLAGTVYCRKDCLGLCGRVPVE